MCHSSIFVRGGGCIGILVPLRVVARSGFYCMPYSTYTFTSQVNVQATVTLSLHFWTTLLIPGSYPDTPRRPRGLQGILQTFHHDIPIVTPEP